MSENEYPKYPECVTCNYYEDGGLYEDPNSCLWECKIHKKYVHQRASKFLTNNKDSQIAFREACEIEAYQKGYKKGKEEAIKE